MCYYFNYYCFYSENGTPITISCLEPAKSFRQLDSQLRIQRTKVNEFLTSMNAFFDLPKALLASLMPLEDQSQGHHELDKMNTMYGQTDTFLKLLLRIEALQDTAIEIMLGKILLLMVHEEPSPEGSSLQAQKQSEQERQATQIFNHIRWCEYLFSPESVVKTCLESLLVLPTSLQIEIIISIPAILTASSISDELLSDLLSIAQGTPDLLPCILETIGNLCLAHGSEGYKQVIR